MFYRTKSYMSLLAGASMLVSASNVFAQQDSMLEEIVVTAQKREQNLQDVPVAVTAYTGDMLQNSGITDLRDLAAIAPTLRSNQSQNSTTASFGIRGIGTSSQNFGLESSVGIYVDGVYRSRQSSVINDLADIESVEILRGPQGTLFGKNTPSGALVVRTVKPSHDRNAHFEVTAGDYGLVNLKAASSFSLSEDKAALRLSLFSGTRDGTVSELTAGNDVINDRDRFGARAQLLLTPSDKLEVRIIADYAEIDEICCAALPRLNNFSDMAGTKSGTDAFIAAPPAFGGLGLPVITSAQFGERIMAINALPRSTNEDSGLSLEINYDFENSTLTSISSLRNFDSTDLIDADFGAGDLLFDQNLSDQSSFAQEFRLDGTFGKGGNYTVGVYYFEQDLNNLSTLTLRPDTDAFFGLDPLLGGLRAAIDGFSVATGGAYPLTAASFPDGAFATDDMQQQHESVAVFGQFDFELSDVLTLTAGLRYTDESKEMIYNYTNNQLGPPPDFNAILQTLGALQLGLLNPADPADAAIIFGAFGPTYVPGWGLYTLPSLAPQAGGTEVLEDDQVTGTVKLSWFASDDVMFYASWGTGYKAGGTNTDRIDPSFDQVFGAETSEAIEIGMKSEFPNQNIRLNVAIYDTQVEDLQTIAFVGSAFFLANAGNADTQGLELEMLWVPTHNLNVNFSYVYNKADLEDFPNGPCWVATPWQTGTPDPGTTPGQAGCDRSGGRVSSNPEHIMYLGARQEFQVGSSTRLFISAEGTRISDTITDGNNDPLKLRDDFNRFNARVGLIFENIDAELSLWGKNITDEQFYETVFDVPVQDGKLNAYVHDPATWGITFRKNFQ
jgi:outer membrane receptor protein involved in Fe transport